MQDSIISKLEQALTDATLNFKKMTAKKMFGCHALWANENVFALVWKHGRIGFKLPDEAAYTALLKLKGSEPWKAGPMTMSHWVLVPEAFHGKPAELKKWATQAHSQCSVLVKKPTAKKKASAKVKKTAQKKAVKKS
jgi:TfoX/Sxy family transcriptional regulator of competence genes